MGKTIEVAADRSFNQDQTVLPTEVARGVYMQNAPSLAALKLLHLLIATAGGRMAEDVEHHLRLAAIREIDGMDNHTRDSLAALFAELSGAVMTYDDTTAMILSIGGILDEARISYRNERSGDLLITWWFGRSFRRMAEASNHWAILDRQTVFHLTSKYSVLLFQHVSSFQNYRYISSKTFSIQDLRNILGIPAKKLERFSNLNQRVLQPALAEINQLSRLQLALETHKVGRSVESVTISWQEKRDLKDAKKELKSSKVGRVQRRSGGIEEVVWPAFPSQGGIGFDDYWLGLKHAAGCNMDNTIIAARFRGWCKENRIALDSKGIGGAFTNYCQKVGKV